MKNVVLALIAFFPLLVFSQKDFEGIITYKGFKSNLQNSFEAKFFLSNGKVKVTTIYRDLKERKGSEYVIYNFISNIAYHIDEQSKSFSVASLDEPSIDEDRFTFKDTSLAQRILGYACRAYVMKTEKESFESGFWAISWYSDSLKFIIPAKYRRRTTFSSLPDGNMLFLKVVGFETNDYDDDKIKTDTFYINAENIERMQLNESEFLPPAGYSKITEEFLLDSLLVDTSRIKVPTPEEIKKDQPKKPAAAKPSKPSQSPAKKEKEVKPVKG